MAEEEQGKIVDLAQASTSDLLASLGVKLRLDPIEEPRISYERGGVAAIRDDHFPDKSRGAVMQEVGNRVPNMERPDLALVDEELTGALSAVRVVGAGVARDLSALYRKIGGREAALNLQQNSQQQEPQSRASAGN